MHTRNCAHIVANVLKWWHSKIPLDKQGFNPMSLVLRHYNQSRTQSSARPPPRTADGDEEVIRHVNRQPPWKVSLPVAKNIIFNQLHIVSHSCSGVSQWKYTFDHSTLTLSIFKSLRGRIMHFIVSICFIAVVPMSKLRPRTQLGFSCAANAKLK